ncbi:hypothetical protein BGZ76_005656 [Entomortierella beljakovae]|nr:hypothetical protein BGZ76_005656 [Entomortierella beljakovae]
MALVQSLAVSAAGTRLLRDENDTMEQVAARGISYILFYAIFGNLVRWSYGFNLLVPNDSEEQEQTMVHDIQHRFESPRESLESSEQVLIDMDQPQETSTSHQTAMSSASSMRTLSNPQDFSIDNGDQSSDDEPSHTGFLRSSLTPKHQQISTHMQELSSSTIGHARVSSGPMSRYNSRRRRRTHRESTKTKIKKTTSMVFNRIRRVLTPPLITAILALLVGLVPFLHKFFMSSESKFYSFIVRPLEGCGEAAIPMILVCLGAQVLHFATSSSSSDEQSAYSPVRPILPRRRRSIVTPSIFPHADDGSDSSSSESETQDQGWLQVQIPSRRNSRYRNPQPQLQLQTQSLPSPTEYNGYSSDDEITISQSAFNGGSELGLRAHRFKWLGPVPFVLLSRMVLVPLICLPAILFHPSTLSPILTTDRTFSLALVLIAASPTAINMIQLCQIKGFFEQDMAGVLFWSYCVLGIPCILAWSLVGLWAASRY